MDLEEYLHGIENCPDETIIYNGREKSKLTVEYGVYDNFEILIKSNFSQVIRFFNENKNYQIKSNQSNENSSDIKFLYKPGTVIGRVSERHSYYKGEPHDHLSGLEKEHFMKQKGFNLILVLHPYQDSVLHPEGKIIENISAAKALSLVIYDFGKWALKENIPICVPQAGWKYINYLDSIKDEYYSNIIYFEPDKT